MHHPTRLRDPQGFVRLSFVCSDGLQGEALLESADAEKTFHYLRSQIPQGTTYCPRNQLTLDLSVAEAKSAAHTFK